jgi:hypothetical protein
MTFRNRITRATALALAIAALAAPTALARPADVPARSAGPSAFPTRPVLDRPSAPASPRPDTTPNVVVDDNGSDWATIGLGVGGGLLAVGAIAGVAGRTRNPRRGRIAA